MNLIEGIATDGIHRLPGFDEQSLSEAVIAKTGALAKSITDSV